MIKIMGFFNKAGLCLCLVLCSLCSACTAVKPQPGRKHYNLVVTVPYDDLSALLASVNCNAVSVNMQFDEDPYRTAGRARLLLSVSDDAQLRIIERQLAGSGLRVIASHLAPN